MPLVQKGRGRRGLAEKLGPALDIPLKLLRELLSRATAAVRARLMASASPEAKNQIQEALAGIANEIGQEATGPRNFTELKRAWSRNSIAPGKLKEPVLLAFANERKYEEMTSTLALFCQARVDLVEMLEP